MVDITPMVAQGVQIIHGYGDGKFRIGEVSHAGPVLVQPESTLVWEVASDVSIPELDLATLAPIFEVEETYDILLIGTGTRQVFLPPARRAEIRAMGPVAEVMDTGAACRTFNLLLAEGRRVAAALLPVE
ncbi:MAG: Mth938-like domain-containing protein [Thalassobaculaceae bacterium]|nr:Mth938-like domain-containing protein [Thalassobaculaceae bacterium]